MSQRRARAPVLLVRTGTRKHGRWRRPKVHTHKLALETLDEKRHGDNTRGVMIDSGACVKGSLYRIVGAMALRCRSKRASAQQPRARMRGLPTDTGADGHDSPWRLLSATEPPVPAHYADSVLSAWSGRPSFCACPGAG